MKFLIDEDVPIKLLKALNKLGHDVIRVEPSIQDPEVARIAKEEGRVLITLDKDFTNTVMYPPTEFNIVQIQIHPPYADRIIEPMKELLESLSPDEFKGLIVLLTSGHLRISK